MAEVVSTKEQAVFRHAVIGCGKVAGYGHLPAVNESPQLKLSAICEADEQRRRQVCEKYGVPGFASVEQMFAAVELDSVTICTTLPTHHELALKVAAAGKHCFLEKPMARDSQECDQIVAAFEKAGGLLAINFEYRVSRLMRSVHDDIQAGRIGKLLSIRLVYNWDNHWHRPEFHARRAAFLNESFGCMDCGVHYLDIGRWIGGSEFVRLSAEGTWAEPQYRYPSHIHAMGRLANGVMYSLEESFAYSLNARDRLCVQYLDFVGDLGVIHIARPIPDGDDMIVCRHFADHTSMTQEGDGKPWAGVYEQFASGMAAGSLCATVLASGRDGAEAVRLTERIIADCDRGRMDRPE